MKLKGFTLLELMVVMAITGVFTTLVIPSGLNMLKSVKISNASNTLHRSLKYARAEAIMRSKPIRICASSNGVTCSQDKNWANGWLIYVDETDNSVRMPEDPILRHNSAMEGLDIRYNLKGHSVRFNEMGRLSRNGSFYVCDASGRVSPNRLVMIHSGRVRQTPEGARCD